MTIVGAVGVVAAGSARGRRRRRTRSVASRDRRPSPLAQATAVADADRHARRPTGDARRRPPTPVADAAPDRHPAPDARPRPGAADRPARHPGGRRPPPDRGDDRRPPAGPAAVRAVVGVGRLAGPGRGRHPALHGDLPGRRCPRTSGRSAARATTTSPGPPSGGRSTPTPAARRRRKATLRAKGNGQYVYNVDEFRYSGTFYRITTRPAPHNLYTTGAKLRAPRQARRAPRTRPTSRSGSSRPDAPLEARPYGGTITVSYPYNTITLQVRPRRRTPTSAR